MGGVRLSNKFSYFYILRDTFFGFGFLHSCFLFFFFCALFVRRAIVVVLLCGISFRLETPVHGSRILDPRSCSVVEPFSLCITRLGVAGYKILPQLGQIM